MIFLLPQIYSGECKMQSNQGSWTAWYGWKLQYCKILQIFQIMLNVKPNLYHTIFLHTNNIDIFDVEFDVLSIGAM